MFLSIVTINGDNRYVQYEWDSMEDFIHEMENDEGNDEAIIPDLEDPLAEVDSTYDELQIWWRESICNRVVDLLEECRAEVAASEAKSTQ